MAQKKVVMLVVGVFLFAIFLSLISAATSTQQYNKILFNPYYKDSLTARTNYTANLTINPPDKISSVVSSIVNLQYITGTSYVMSLWINNKTCNTPTYSVTSNGFGIASFDCSNIITKAGVYQITYQSSGNIGSVVGSLDLTYMNAPSSLTIHGTEYNSGDPAKIWLQLLDSGQQPITNATCFLTLYQPNNVPLLQGIQMTKGSNGIYYYDFYAPDVIGVYPAVADCFYVTELGSGIPSNYSIASNGTLISGDLNSLKNNDGNRWKLQEGIGINESYALDFNITLNGINDTSLETSFVVGMRTRWNGLMDEEMTMMLWNYTSNSWITLPNKFTNSQGLDIDWTNSLDLTSANATALGYVKNGTSIIRVVDTTITNPGYDDDLSSILQLDSVWISIISQSTNNVWQEIKGSSEVHVNSGGGHLYNWETLCGNRDNTCAIFSSDPNYFEGIQTENITVKNTYQKSLSDYLEYETGLGLDCTGVLSVKEYYDNGEVIDVYNQTRFNVGNYQNCKMKVPVSLETNDKIITIEIIMDNYPKWEVEWAKNVVDGLVPTIENYCNNVASNLGLNYTVPLTGNPVSNDSVYNYCSRAMDDIWYFYKNYNDSQTIDESGPYLSYLSESRFYYPILYDHYTKIKQDLVPPSSGSIKLSGTEYSPGDPATVFLQLVDSLGNPVNSANCFVDIWYPFNGTTHPYIVQDAPMTQAPGTDGMYYYDLTAPSQLGVYMLGARCSFGGSTQFFYSPTEIAYSPSVVAVSGTWTIGSSQVLNSYTDGLYISASSAGGAAQTINATINMTVYGTVTNTTNITSVMLYAGGSCTQAGGTLTMKYWNGTTFVSLPNSVTWIGGASATTPSITEQFLSNTIPPSAVINGILKVQLTSTPTGGTQTSWIDWLSSSITTSGGTIQTLRGSSEMHVTNIPNVTANLVWTWNNRTLTTEGNNLIAQAVWNYASRNLTYFDFVTQALFVWNSTSRNLTYFDYVTQAGNVWNYSMRNLTYFDFVTQGLVVWNTTSRNLTYFDFATQAGVVWNYTNRNLTYTPDVTNYLLAAQTVWNYTGGRNLTYFDFVTAALNVWNSTSRNLTYYQDVTNYTQISSLVNSSLNTIVVKVDLNAIATSVWNYTSRNLTYTPDMTNYSLISQTVWNYVSRNLTYTPDLTNYNLIQALVWNNTVRNLTFYPTQQDLTNYTLIGQTIWNFANRNLTYYDLGNNLSASDVWNFVSRNLTYTQDVINYSLITENVWSFSNRTLTLYQVNNITPADIWGYVNRSLTENVSQEVWLYYNRTLTFVPDVMNYSLQSEMVWNFTNRSLTENLPLEIWTYTNRTLTENISLDVWTFYNRSLTFYPDVTNYSLINDGVWTYNNRSLTFYADVTNYTQIGIVVWGYTGTINANILNQIAAAIWNYAGSIAVINNQIATTVWNFPARYTHGEILD